MLINYPINKSFLSVLNIQSQIKFPINFENKIIKLKIFKQLYSILNMICSVNKI
jgi:hypothetical protein